VTHITLISLTDRKMLCLLKYFRGGNHIGWSPYVWLMSFWDTLY